MDVVARGRHARGEPLDKRLKGRVARKVGRRQRRQQLARRAFGSPFAKTFSLALGSIANSSLKK
jgi:hypothetical protein